MTAVGSVAPMTEAERQRISGFIEKEFGIKMPAVKKNLLEGRLAKRLVAVGLPTYQAYFNFVTTSPQGQAEYFHFQDLVSTHETSFFRENSHFLYLGAQVLPSWLRTDRARDLRILSAACSTGEEAYSLAMTTEAAIQTHGSRGASFLVEGVDLSTHVVEVARRGVYPLARCRSVPDEFRQRYLMAGKAPKAGLCRVVPELRQRVRFHQGNLLSDHGLDRRSYDLIFCRNVLIYFDPVNQRRVLETLLAHLRPGGLLFLGHSESMIGLEMPVRSVSQAVFQVKD